MIVADTNLFAYLYIGGEQTSLAEAVFLQDPLWAAPLLWRSEFRNILAGLVRRKSLTLPVATDFIRETEGWMKGREYAVVSYHVLDLAAKSGCSAYDCEFVALAEDLSVKLVTNDRQILKAFPRIAIAPKDFAG